MLNRRHVLLVILTVKKLLERFTKKICKKRKKKNQKQFRVEKVIKRDRVMERMERL